MLQTRKTLIYICFYFILTGCSSEDTETATDIVNAVTEPSINHNSAKFNPYGFFAGEVAYDGESKGIFVQIDDATEVIYFNTLESITVGNYDSKGQGRYQADEISNFTIDETSILDFIWRGGYEEARISDDFIFSYTFDEFRQDFQWTIIDGDNTTLELTDLDVSVASSITRAPSAPAKEAIVTGQYVLQLDGAVLPAYTLTLDLLEGGEISGVDTKGCIILGEYNIGNTHVNSYPLTVEITNCDIRGNYSGIMTAASIEDSKSTSLIISLHNSINALFVLISKN